MNAIIPLMVIITSLLSANVAAEEVKPNKWQPGFSGTIMGMFGGVQTQDQADSGDKKINSLDDKAEKKNKAFFLPISTGILQYTLDSGEQQFYIGTDQSDLAIGRVHFELGYKQYVKQAGTFSLGIVPGLLKSDTWEDPYLVGENRDKTKAVVRGLRFKYENIMASQFSIELAAGKQVIKDEQSASGANYTDQERALLQREGNVYFAQLSHVNPITQSFYLRSALSYKRLDADGAAMASNSYGGDLSFIKVLHSSNLVLNIRYHHIDFDESNPVFENTQSDNKYGVIATYVYKNLFGWKGVGVGAAVGYIVGDSNIDFYDSSNALVSTGVSYSF
ncbi:DUF2860 family protein [Vibrio algicola]|nr:DUF2860 family protein [Vibrio algicola]